MKDLAGILFACLPQAAYSSPSQALWVPSFPSLGAERPPASGVIRLEEELWVWLDDGPRPGKPHTLSTAQSQLLLVPRKRKPLVVPSPLPRWMRARGEASQA